MGAAGVSLGHVPKSYITAESVGMVETYGDAAAGRRGCGNGCGAPGGSVRDSGKAIAKEMKNGRQNQIDCLIISVKRGAGRRNSGAASRCLDAGVGQSTQKHGGACPTLGACRPERAPEPATDGGVGRDLRETAGSNVAGGPAGTSTDSSGGGTSVARSRRRSSRADSGWPPGEGLIGLFTGGRIARPA